MWLLIFLIILFVLVNSGKKQQAKKTKGQENHPINADAAKSPSAQAARAKPAKSAASGPSARAQKPRPADQPLTAAQPTVTVQVRAERSPASGSLGPYSQEGESPAEHARHVEMARQEREQAFEARQAAEELRRANVAELRKAVIMSEILGKPKALRRGRNGSYWNG